MLLRGDAGILELPQLHTKRGTMILKVSIELTFNVPLTANGAAAGKVLFWNCFGLATLAGLARQETSAVVLVQPQLLVEF
jgi:hypothetical protein